MRIARKLLALAVVSLAATSVHAEGSYLGLGLGLQFNLGDLGETITKDGLDTSKYDSFSVTTSGLPSVQKLIVPENTLAVYSNSGIMTSNRNGPMHGGVLSLFWEKEGQNTFWRVGVDYTRKILGGHTEATFAGAKWLNQIWTYQNIDVPVYWGIKAGVGESASVYGAIGLHYYRGGWGIEGDDNGQIPYELSNGLFNVGTHATTNLYQGAAYTSGDAFPVIGEKIRFDVSGIGFNFMIGFETKLQSGNKMYIEIEHMIGGEVDIAPVRSLGAIASLASTGSIAYPINLSGTRYKFGYKMAM